MKFLKLVLYTLLLGVGALIIIGSVMINVEKSRLEELRLSDPAAYLAETQPEVDKLLAELKQIPAEDRDANIDRYGRLAVLRPDEARYKEKAEYYRVEKEKDRERAIRRRREVEEQRLAEDRRAGFHCLSKWDGSHDGFKKTIRDNLKNPASFDHVETKITPVDAEGWHSLFMTYRATNSFNAIITQRAVARVRQSDCKYSIVSAE